MSTPENPFDAINPPEVPIQQRVPENVTDVGLAQRFPLWTLADVLRVAAVLVFALVFTSVLMFLIAAGLPAYKTAKSTQIATDARLVVPAQAVAYALVTWFIYRMIARHYHAPFLQSVHWNFPRKTWPAFVAFGVALSFAVQLLTRVVPVPKELPLDQYFTTQSGVWMMAVFGTLIAPVAEELFFRGLLYPALVVKIGFEWAVAATSVAFALVHAAQLGRAWGPVLMLFVVGFVLTLVRARAQSLAASMLVHVSYNGTIFALMYLGTQGFTRLDRLGR